MLAVLAELAVPRELAGGIPATYAKPAVLAGECATVGCDVERRHRGPLGNHATFATRRRYSRLRRSSKRCDRLALDDARVRRHDPDATADRAPITLELGLELFAPHLVGAGLDADEQAELRALR